MSSQIKPEQIKVLGLAVVGLVVLGATGWLGWSHLQGALGEAQAFVERKSVPKVASAFGHPGGAEKIRQETKELKALHESARQQLDQTVRTWQESWRETSGDGADWSTDPGRWKDKLIETRSFFLQQSRNSEREARVVFPDDFYLSLGEFQQKSPSAEEVPDLARQLSVARRLIEILVQAKREAKEAYPTPCVFRILERLDPAEQKEVPGKPPPRTPPPKSPLVRLSFRMQIEASPEVLFAFVRGLKKDPWLFVIQDLLVQNEQTQFPSRSEIRKKFESPKDSGEEAGRSVNRPKLLEVLAGKEKIQATLRIESIGWAPGSAPQPPPGP